MLVTKKEIKKDVKDIKTLIKAYKVVQYDETVVALELCSVIYNKGLNFYYKVLDYLTERKVTYDLKHLNKLLDDLKSQANVFRVECLIAYVIGYLNL